MYLDERSLSHVNSIPRYIKLLTFSIACPFIFTLVSFSSGFLSKDHGLCLYPIYMHSIPYRSRSLPVCNLLTVSANFSLLCSIISMSSANLRLFTRLPWTAYSTVFLYSWLYPLFSPGTKQMIVVSMDLLVDNQQYHSLRCPLTKSLKLLTVSHCNCFYQSGQFLVHPIWFITAHSPSCHTESNAFL